MKSTPSYAGGASSASWRNQSFLACQQSNCGTMMSIVYRVHPKNNVWQRAAHMQVPQMLLESTSKETLPARVSLRPTIRAADKWDAPRFLGMFLAISWFRFDGESTLRPLVS